MSKVSKLENVSGNQELDVRGFSGTKFQITIESNHSGSDEVTVKIKPNGASNFHPFTDNTIALQDGEILFIEADAVEMRFETTSGSTYNVFVSRL